MALDRSFIGRTYPTQGPYQVAREKVREFALAIGATHPVHVDLDAARAAGHPDLLAPPTFLTVLLLRYAAAGPVMDPALGLDYTRVVHGAQRFTAHQPVHAGDEVLATTSVEEIRAAGGNDLLTVRTQVTSARDGAAIATLQATLISRGTA